MPALMLTSDSRLLLRAREAFLEVMKDDRYASERTEIMEEGRRRFDRQGRFFARN